MNEEGFGPIFQQYDPHKWLHWAKERHGWIVEYTHRATREFLSRPKEISVESLRRRFEKVHEVGKDAVWLAPPEAVADYILVHRHTEIAGVVAAPGQLRFALAVRGLPERVQRRELTIIASFPAPVVQPAVLAEGEVVSGVESRGAEVLFTVTVRDGLSVDVSTGESGGRRLA